jgi:O-antigen ligase
VDDSPPDRHGTGAVGTGASGPGASGPDRTGAPLAVGLAAVFVFVLTQGPVYTTRLRFLGGFDGWWEDPVNRGSFAAVGLAGAGLLVAHLVRHGRPELSRTQAVAAGALCALVALSVTSALWSDAPGHTLSRALLLTGTTAAGAWLGLRLDPRDQAAAVALATAAGGLISLFTIWWRPDIGVMLDDKGDPWAGIYLNANSLAPVAAVGIVAAGVLAWRARPVLRVPLLALGAMHVVLLLGSQSNTALGALLAGVGVAAVAAVAARALRTGTSARRVGTAVLGGLGVAAAGLTLTWPAPMRAGGGDGTLVGRTGIWRETLPFIGDRPVGGYGAFVFWDGPGNAEISAILERRVTDAHNSVLDMALGVGLVGPVLFALAVAATAWSLATAVARSRRVGPIAWWIVVLAYTVVAMQTESFWQPAHFLWMLMVATVVGAGRRPSPGEGPVPDPVSGPTGHGPPAPP